MAKEKLFQVGIKGLIEDSVGRILLFKADVSKFRLQQKAYWDIPGGRIQEGQTAAEALQREIEEETGIKTIAGSKFFTSVISNHQIPIAGTNKKSGLVLMIYKVQIPKGSKVVMSEEHTGVEWVDKQEAAKRLSDKYPPEFTNLL
jgi:8-oxo-dGTP pyrophosphatase MutT (NUDIX family)